MNQNFRRINNQTQQKPPQQPFNDITAHTFILLLVALLVSSCNGPNGSGSQASHSHSTGQSRKKSSAQKNSAKAQKLDHEDLEKHLREYALLREKVIRASEEGKVELVESEILKFEQAGGRKDKADDARSLSSTILAIKSKDKDKMHRLGKQFALSADPEKLAHATDLFETAGFPKEAVDAQLKLISELKKSPALKNHAKYEFDDLAKLRAQAGDWKGCTEAFAQAAEFTANKPSFVNKRLWCSFQGNRNTLDELSALKNRKNNKSNQALFDQARLESALGLEIAQSHFSEFCKNDKERAYLGHYHLAEIAYYKGDYSKSAEEMAQVWNVPLNKLGKPRKAVYSNPVLRTESLITVVNSDEDPETSLNKGIAAQRIWLDPEKYYLKAFTGLPKQSQAKVQAGILLYVFQRQAGYFSQCKATLDDLDKLAAKGWPQPLIRYFRNEISEADLLASAKGNNTTLTRYYYYLSCIDHCMQDRTAEKRHLTWLKHNGDTGVDEYELAEPQFSRCHVK